MLTDESEEGRESRGRAGEDRAAVSLSCRAGSQGPFQSGGSSLQRWPPEEQNTMGLVTHHSHLPSELCPRPWPLVFICPLILELLLHLLKIEGRVTFQDP